MSLFYITADNIGEETGGGLVTFQELTALQEFSAKVTVERKDPNLSTVEVYSRKNLGSSQPEPWKWDDKCQYIRDWYVVRPRLAHFYSGTFGNTVELIKRNGGKVAYTIAAHDKEVSKREHEKLGLSFPYTHLTDTNLWKRYTEGYRLADVIVCPGTVAANTVRAYGPEFENKDIRIIPHGCVIPEETTVPPLQFVVGYLGSYGADKGVRYLLEAWKKLNYQDGSILALGGRDSTSPGVRQFVQTFGGGSVHLAGWQQNVSNFYNSISVYVQPSATEGFGIEIIEAMAHGRMALCSDGAGGCDVVPDTWRFPACNADALAEIIDEVKKKVNRLETGKAAREVAKEYTWDKISTQYQEVWGELLQ